MVTYITVNKNLDVIEDIKQNITDNQYKIIMDSLMIIHKTEEKKLMMKALVINVLLY